VSFVDKTTECKVYLQENIFSLWWEVFEKCGSFFPDKEEVETEMRKWLRQQSKYFYAAGFDALVKQ
jgi:hypothetical protein